MSLKQVAFVSLLLMACGPVNEKSEKSNRNRTETETVEIDGLAVMAQHLFLVSLHSTDDTTHETAAPHRGVNRFVIHVVRAADLSTLSTAAELEVSYIRASSRYKLTYKAPVERQSDGSFAATTLFKKSGDWELHVKIRDGVASDEYVLKISL